MDVLFFLVIVFSVSWVLGGLLAGSDPFFFLRPVVYLEDSWERVYKCRLHLVGGKKYSYVYSSAKVGLVKLNDDGTTSGVSYIKHWWVVE